VNYFYTESACDACPRQCRAGIFVGDSEGQRPAMTCPTDATPTWRVGEYVKSAPAPHIKLDTVTKVTAVKSGTVLLCCTECRTPCLFEVTGPSPVPRCVAGMTKDPTWFRVTE
jgi:hypothetical protein